MTDRIDVRTAVVLLLFAVGCDQIAGPMTFPTKDKIPEGSVTSIDGNWIGYTVPIKGARLRLERGRLFTTAPFQMSRGVPVGSVLARDVKQIGPTTFECDWFIPRTFMPDALFVQFGPGRYMPTRLELTTSRSLLARVPPHKGESLSLDEDTDQVLLRENNSTIIDNQDRKITIDKEPKRILLESEVVRIPQGSTFRTTRSRTLEHAVTLEFDTALHGELSLDAIEFVKVNVKGDIERKEGRTFKDTETVSREITLDGNRGQRYQIAWYGRYLTGTTAVSLGSSKEAMVPFRFLESEELSVELIR